MSLDVRQSSVILINDRTSRCSRLIRKSLCIMIKTDKLCLLTCRDTEIDLDIRKYADVTKRNFERPSEEQESEENSEKVHKAEERIPGSKSSTEIKDARSRDAKAKATVKQEELDEFNETKLNIDDDMKTFRQFVKKEELIEMMKIDLPMHGVCRYLDENIEKWKVREVNIAITGQSGAGKSSLINTFINAKPSFAERARVGVTETTSERKKYTYLNNSNCNVVLWDLPGVGTLKFPKQTYLEKMDYKKYDVFIIVFKSRVLKKDVWLAKELLSKGKRVLFARTQIDTDMRNAEYDYPESYDETRLLSEIKDDIKTNLKKKAPLLEKDIFLVSARNRELYDFPEMDSELERIINCKGIAISKLVYVSVSKYMMDFTTTLLENNFGVRKFVAHAIRFLPEFVDVGICNHFVKDIHAICLERYGLDSESLRKIDNEHKYMRDQARLKLYWLHPDMYTVKDENAFPIFGSIFPLKKFFRSGRHLETNVPNICWAMHDCVLHLVKLRLNKLQDQLQVTI